MSPAHSIAVCVLLLTVAPACGGPPAMRTLRATSTVNAEAIRTLAEGARAQRRGRSHEDEAIARYRAALVIDETLWEAHFDIATILRRRRAFADALAELAAARRLEPNDARIILAEAEVREASGDRAGAINALRPFVEAHPDHVPTQLVLSALLRAAGDTDAAIAAASRVLVRDSRHVDALLEIARSYRARNQLDVATLVARKALDIAPESAATFNELGLIALARGDTQDAFSELARAVEADPRFAPSRLNQASVLLGAGDYAGAAEQYRAVLGATPDHTDARIGLGIALRGAGEHARARAEWERVLEASPDEPAALFNLGVLRAEFLNERPGSLELFRRFLSVASGNDSRRAVAERYLREIGSEGATGNSE